MTKEELKISLTEILPSATFEETGEWLNVFVAAEEWKPFAQKLKENFTPKFNFLFCLTCIDWKTNLTMVYHLTSMEDRQVNLVVKVKLDRANPQVETVCDLWRGAELFEREVYEMFGVNFINHPDLRRLILPDEWDGYPLRKDYEDPINMIKL